MWHGLSLYYKYRTFTEELTLRMNEEKRINS